MCKYCEEGFALVDGDYLGLAIVNTADDEKKNAYIRGYDKYGWDISEVFQMNYCCNCGKKLIK